MRQDRGRHAQLLNLDGIPLTGSIGTTPPALKRGLDRGRVGTEPDQCPCGTPLRAGHRVTCRWDGQLNTGLAPPLIRRRKASQRVAAVQGNLFPAEVTVGSATAMPSASLDRIASLCALLSGLGSLVYALAFLVLRNSG